MAVVVIAVFAASLPAVGQAFGPSGGTETAELSLPPNSNGTAVTSELPSTVKQGTIRVTLDSNDTDFFDTLTGYLLKGKPTFGARAISCVLLYSSLVNEPDNETAFTIKEPTLQLLFLDVCIRLAATLPTHRRVARAEVGDVASRAAATCRTASKGVALRIVRSGSGYAAKVRGKTFTPKGSSPIKISCRRSARALLISVRPRSRTATLRQVVGSNLGIGFSNPTSRPGHLRISFTVR